MRVRSEKDTARHKDGVNMNTGQHFSPLLHSSSHHPPPVMDLAQTSTYISLDLVIKFFTIKPSVFTLQKANKSILV